MKKILLLLLLSVFTNSFSQSYIIYKGDTINRTIKDTIKVGKWITFKNDKPFEEKYYLNNKANGLVVGYYPDGKESMKVAYIDGKPTGVAIVYYDTLKNIIKETGVWKNHRWIGSYNLYYPNGGVKQAFTFNNKGKREGIQKYYYESGIIQLFIFTENGEEMGFVKYDAKGKRVEYKFKDALVNGSSIQFDTLIKKGVRKLETTAPFITDIPNKEIEKAQIENKVLFLYFIDNIVKKENETIFQRENLYLVQIENQKQKQQKNYFIIGLLIVLVFAGFIFRSLRIRNKQNKIISQQKTVVERKNEIVEHQKQIVEAKNQEITDSIEYALRIQTAILPPQRIVKQYLENSFIVYKPKDIVAGDFYWMETVQLNDVLISQYADEKNQHISTSANQLILFAACDCTGHGVPGAMVSVVCHNALNRAVREFGLTQPAAILDKTAAIVIENFSKSEEDIKDGMDISLCALTPPPPSFKEGAGGWSLEWAGANNPLWLLQNGELIETKADKQPIGMNEDSKPFTNHSFTLNKGDTIYLFTDGFADQFGGDTGNKKLTKKRFKDLLLSIQTLSMEEQGSSLDTFITNYRSEVEQIDDILVIGVRV